MYELLIKSGSPLEFKEAVTGLYGLFAGESNGGSQPGSVQTGALKPLPPAKAAEEKKPAESKPAEEKKVEPAKNAAAEGQPTLETLRVAVTEFQQKGEANREILRSLFKKFGSKGISGLAADQYAAFLTDLKAS